MRACADNSITDQEQRYLQALQSAGRFEVSGSRLMIWFENGRGILNFVAAGA